MPRRWYLIVKVSPSARVALMQFASSLEDAVKLAKEEMLDRFGLAEGSYEFLEVGIQEEG